MINCRQLMNTLNMQRCQRCWAADADQKYVKTGKQKLNYEGHCMDQTSRLHYYSVGACSLILDIFVWNRYHAHTDWTSVGYETGRIFPSQTDEASKNALLRRPVKLMLRRGYACVFRRVEALRCHRHRRFMAIRHHQTVSPSRQASRKARESWLEYLFLCLSVSASTSISHFHYLKRGCMIRQGTRRMLWRLPGNRVQITQITCH